MDLSLPLEFKHIQESVRQFVSRELAPFEQQIDAADELDPALMQELRRRAVELGVYGFNIPSELGGGGLGPLGEVVIGQETGRTSMPLAEAIGRIPYALTRCSSEQVDWLLKPILQAHKTACIALTESEAGSDLGGIRTRAVPDGDSWLLTGSKQFISNAETSDYILVLAVTDPTAPLRKRFTVFVVDRSTPGLVFTHRFRKMGWHGYHVSSFSLDECQVGPERVLGPVGGGFDTIMASVNTTRLYIAARCVGAARYLQELATEHAKTRTTFGRRLADHQAIQFMLADMDVEIEAAQLLTLAAAARGEEGTRDFRITVSRAKLYATEMVGRVADTTLQIFGGAGYMSELPIERIYRDMRGYRIGEGSSEMQRLQIAKHALARG